MQTIVTIKKNGFFTEENLKTVKSFLRTEAFPQFYTNIEFKSLEYIDTILIDESLILRDGFGSSQSPRHEGLNPKYDELKTDITENGFKLYEKPITVKEISRGKFLLVDGRTKDKILHEKGFKNRICNLVKIDECEEDILADRLNAGEDRSPAGLVKEVDIISLVTRKIQVNQIELDQTEILNLINKICGKGKFTAKRRSDLSFLIYHQQNAIQSSSLLPIAWANNKEVNSWLSLKNYIETPTVIYLPFAASSPIKAIFAAAKLSQQNPNKEVRLVVYVSKLSGYDLKKCYLEAVLKFKRMWYEYMDLLGKTYFNGANYNLDKVKVYGCVPSQIEDICEDMEKLIIFGKNDQKINDNYITNTSLSVFFDLDEDEEEDNE